jgi:hypothetical protein
MSSETKMTAAQVEQIRRTAPECFGFGRSVLLTYLPATWFELLLDFFPRIVAIARRAGVHPPVLVAFETTRFFRVKIKLSGRQTRAMRRLVAKTETAARRLAPRRFEHPPLGPLVPGLREALDLSDRLERLLEPDRGDCLARLRWRCEDAVDRVCFAVSLDRTVTRGMLEAAHRALDELRAAFPPQDEIEQLFTLEALAGQPEEALPAKPN